jgi:hypothetical protein
VDIAKAWLIWLGKLFFDKSSILGIALPANNPYPGFKTDLLAFICTFLVVDGKSDFLAGIKTGVARTPKGCYLGKYLVCCLSWFYATSNLISV